MQLDQLRSVYPGFEIDPNFILVNFKCQSLPNGSSKKMLGTTACW